MKEELKKKAGITLIALVLTIIVLLILAGVSIATLTGENGILTRASKASEETKKASEDEQRKLAMLEAATNTKSTTFEEVTIPAGFAPTRIEGESTVHEGLVIIDSEGNEFVWIPCEYDSTTKGDATDPVYYNDTNVEGESKDNRDSAWRDKQYFYNGGTWYDSQPHSKEVKDSIETHHGFYVARYEAGVPENASFYVNEKSSKEKLGTYPTEVAKNVTKEDDKDLAPVSKKGNQVWNFISQTNAVTVAGNMVDNSDVKSYLIDSHAWNTICRLIQKKYDQEKVTNSTKWGNHINNITTQYEKLKGLWADYDKGDGTWKEATKYETGSIPKKTSNRNIELATGMCEDFKAYNIYDLAGNMWEWTTETGKKPENNSSAGNVTCKEEDCTNPSEAPNAVYRGGGYTSYGSSGPVVDAYSYFDVDYYGSHVGFRAVLYLK